MKVRCGVDLASVVDLERRMSRARNDAIARFWTPVERAQSYERAASLAARWAAKEAVMKVLGEGLGRIDPQDIEVQVVDGRPRLALHGSAAARADLLGLAQWDVSLTHDATHAMAMVVAFEGADDERA